MSHQVEAGEQHELEHHPGPRQYVGVAVMLAVVTAIEVAIYYVSGIREAVFFVPVLLSLSVVKFALVMLWFMHLKFDSRLFRRLFVTGVVVAVVVFAIVLATFFFRGGAAPAVG